MTSLCSLYIQFILVSEFSMQVIIMWFPRSFVHQISDFGDHICTRLVIREIISCDRKGNLIEGWLKFEVRYYLLCIRRSRRLSTYTYKIVYIFILFSLKYSTDLDFFGKTDYRCWWNGIRPHWRYGIWVQRLPWFWRKQPPYTTHWGHQMKRRTAKPDLL